ncbi:MAG: hypothetical protein ACFFBP_07975 [Promethearchaeota archaeon]
MELTELKSAIEKYIKGIIFCKQSGEYLYDLIFDSDINPVMLSSFIGALSLFGKDNLGKIEEINIKGLNLDMIILSEYEIILILIIDKKLVDHNIREEAEIILDIFYSTYQEEIKGITDVSNFSDFKNFLIWEIKNFYKFIEIF